MISERAAFDKHALHRECGRDMKKPRGMEFRAVFWKFPMAEINGASCA